MSNKKRLILSSIVVILAITIGIGRSSQVNNNSVQGHSMTFNQEEILINKNINILKSSKSPHPEKWKAKEELVQIGQNSVVPLIELLKDQTARYYAIRALGDISDNRAVKELSKLLLDKSYSGRRYAAIALGQIGDNSATPALKEALSDIDYVREDAIDALIKINTQNSKEALKEFFFNSTKDGLQIKIHADADYYQVGDKILISLSFINTSERTCYLLYPKKFFCKSFVIRSSEDGRFIPSIKTSEYGRFIIDKEDFHILHPKETFNTQIEGYVRIWDKGELWDHAYIPTNPFLTIQFEDVAHHIKESDTYEIRLVFQQGEFEKMAAERVGIHNIWQGKEVSNAIQVKIKNDKDKM